MALSTQELAKMITPRGGDESLAVERIRHWVNIGIITAMNGTPGRGSARQFSPISAIDAAVLQAIAIAGIPTAGMFDLVQDALKEAHEEVLVWLADRKRRMNAQIRNSWLEFRFLHYGRIREVKRHTGTLRPDGEPTTSIIVRLDAAFGQLPLKVWDDLDVWSVTDTAARQAETVLETKRVREAIAAARRRK